MKKTEPVQIRCPKCGQMALGNYKHNPHLAKCPTCHAAGKPDIFTYAFTTLPKGGNTDAEQ